MEFLICLSKYFYPNFNSFRIVFRLRWLIVAYAFHGLTDLLSRTVFQLCEDVVLFLYFRVIISFTYVQLNNKLDKVVTILHLYASYTVLCSVTEFFRFELLRFTFIVRLFLVFLRSESVNSGHRRLSPAQ